ncbi:TonB-dependent receptor plug domain-containing protein [Novosphingobium album (ex Liu et al. 2023)]|uniref:TonB-dependent receptor n=1 Tax=Novosphingobium album (ex Liu et al. 2023) TaxID=3031130 RepID=A0ABT5WT70_9SPHN|nr:TonB-dependent receptor [Novosphingobium album (ex Liu et al. 2023)]MDE8652617.1 TonB-dependent receptor [Novosphingobium album (ex Liu et al. 2023)]
MKNNLTRAALRGSTCLALIALALPGAAFAQTASDEASDDEMIIVTGSRIARPEVDAVNPVVAITSQDILDSGTTNVTDYLKTLPALAGSLSSYNNSGDRAGIGYTGLNLLDLRNLGYDRTLVLVDGRRHVAAVDGLQSVDINTIPNDLIERVEVLTGGASAIYGADGVSGVVNFIQKKDFEGVTARVQGGISDKGDAGQRLFALTAGHNFADGRGNFAIAYEHGEEDRLTAQDRKRFQGTNRVGFYLNPDDTETGAQNNDGIPDYIPLNDIRYFDTSRAGGIDVDFDGMPDFYGAEGLPYDPGRFIPSFYQQGGSGTLVSDYGNDLLPQIRRDVVNAIAHFDFSDALTLYAEAKYANTKSYSVGQPSFDYYLFIPEDNPYIPEAVRSHMIEGNGGVLVNRDNFDLGRRGEDITRETIRTVIGAKGDIAPNLSYDVSYVFGRAKITNHYVDDILTDRFYAAIDAVRGPDGAITCRVNLDPTWTPTQPNNYTRSEIPPTTFQPGQCLPFNLFGDGVASQAAIDWVKTDTTDRSRLTQHVVSGAITGNTGSYFELPGGPIGFALGGEYRKESSSFIADPLAQQGLTFTNVLGNTKGNFDVWEVFAEVNVPILADRPFFKRLEINGAFRYSDYSTIGTTNAWKVGGDWAPVDDISFRGTYSKAVRAPNISELFGAQSETFEFINDPCDEAYLQNGTQYRVDNCVALLSGLGVADPSTYSDTRSVNISGFQGGNPNIREETAKTWTAGVVLKPRFIPGLIVTADWYDIRIKNAINTVTPEKVAELCVDQATLDNQYCDAIVRQNGGDNAGFITSFNVGPLNVANFKTAGLDVMIDYRLRTDKAGTFTVHAVGNYLHKQTYVPIPGADPVNDAYYIAGSPKFLVTTDLGWEKGKFGLNWRINYASKLYRYSRQDTANNPDIVAPEYLKLNERFSHDVSFNVDVNDQFEIYGGVNNVFNQKPDLGALNTPISAVGRFMFMGARVKFADLFGGS